MTTPTPWDYPGNRGRLPSHDAGTMRSYSQRESRDPYGRRDSQSQETSSQRERVERLTAPSRQQHTRNDSDAGSSGEYNDGQHPSTGRRHDYDVQAMESDLSPRSGAPKNPIPAPIVTIRSEFPTLNRSRQQQPLTCLITIEVPEGCWRPDAEDLRQAQSAAPQPQEDVYSPARSPKTTSSRSMQHELQENLDEIAEELRTRVDNWHGLDFQRYAGPGGAGGGGGIFCLLFTDTFIGSESCVSTVKFTWAKTARIGRNWSAISSPKCSSA